MSSKNNDLSRKSVIEYKGWFAHNKKLVLMASLVFLFIIFVIVALVVLISISTPIVVNYTATIGSINKKDVDYSTESINITFTTDVPDNEINNVTASYIENDTNESLGYTSEWTLIGTNEYNGTNEYSGTIVASDLTQETLYQGKVVLDYQGTTLDEYSLSFETLPFIIDFTLNTNTVVIDPNLTSGNVILNFDTNILDVENITAYVQVEGTTIGSNSTWTLETEGNYSGNILLSDLTPFIDYEANIIFIYNGDTISNTPITFNTNNEISNITSEIGNVTSTTASINLSFESNSIDNSNVKAFYRVDGVDIGSTNTWNYDSTSSSYNGTINLTNLDSSTNYDGQVIFIQNESEISNTDLSFTTLDLISNIELTPVRIDNTSEDMNIKFQTEVTDTNNISATYVDKINEEMGSTSTWTDNGDGSFSGKILFTNLVFGTTYSGDVIFTYRGEQITSNHINFTFYDVVYNETATAKKYDKTTELININFKTQVSDVENITAVYKDDVTNLETSAESGWTLEDDGSYSGQIFVTDLISENYYSGQIIFSYKNEEVTNIPISFNVSDWYISNVYVAPDKNTNPTVERINVSFYTNIKDIDNIYGEVVETSDRDVVIATNNTWESTGINQVSFGHAFDMNDLTPGTDYECYMNFYYHSTLFAISNIFTFTTIG